MATPADEVAARHRPRPARGRIQLCLRDGSSVIVVTAADQHASVEQQCGLIAGKRRKREEKKEREREWRKVEEKNSPDPDSDAAESFGPFGDRRKPHWAGIPTAADLAKIAAATRDGFTGHEHLDNLGLIHMNGRVYDPQLGRFISADPYATRPFDGQGLNRYAYALNNPLAFTDPGGFDPVPCLATPDGNCVQITVIATSWIEYMRWSGGALRGSSDCSRILRPLRRCAVPTTSRAH